MTRVVAAGCAALFTVALASAAAAQDPPLTSDDYAIDLVTTPVLGSGRIVGLGGAYTALADGVDGALWNPAAYGSRTLWELSWFEWELSFGFLRPSSDFFNSGDGVGQGLTVLSLGFRLQFGDIGFGALPRVINYELRDRASGERDVQVAFTTGNYGLAFQLLEGQVVLGFGVRLGDLAITDLDGGTARDEMNVSGIGPEAGVLLRLADQPWRLGVAARTAVHSDTIECTDRTGNGACDWALPHDLHLPWELQIGFAVQIGNRPLNRRWVDPEIAEQAIEDDITLAQTARERAQIDSELRARGRTWRPGGDPYRWLPERPHDPAFWEREGALRAREREQLDERVEAAEDAAHDEVASLPRTYLLLTLDLLVTGRTTDGVSLDGFVSQTRIRSGEEITYSPRLGVEGEPWAGRLKLRAGTYLEPSRYAGGSYRVHGTAGLDLRLFTWDLFGLLDDFDVRAGGTVDVADRYFDWGIGVGFWH